MSLKTYNDLSTSSLCGSQGLGLNKTITFEVFANSELLHE